MLSSLMLALPLLFSESLKWDCPPCPVGWECFTEVRRAVGGTDVWVKVFSTRGRVYREIGLDGVEVGKCMDEVLFVWEKPFPMAIEYDRQVRHCWGRLGLTECGEWSTKIRCPRRGV